MASLPFKSPYTRQIALWTLRAFSRAKAHKFITADIAKFLRLPKDIDRGAAAKLSPSLGGMLRELELTSQPIGLPLHVTDNIGRLARMCRLNATEQAILQYLVCCKIHPVLHDTKIVLRAFHPPANTAAHFSLVLNVSRKAVANALMHNGRLKRYCLITSESDGTYESFDFFAFNIARDIFQKDFNPEHILRHFGAYAPSPNLELADYPHLKLDLDLLLPYLKKSISCKKKGVNFLFYGAPGTGKSQLARVLGLEAGIPVFELATEDADGDSILPASRLDAIQTAHMVLQDRHTLLVFDEAEDIFSSAPSERSAVMERKGWFNRMLETHGLPIVWISNSIHSLDDAILRRFDFIIEVPIPPKKQRRKILHDVAGAYMTPTLIGKLAESEHISPAVVARTHDVIRSIGKALPAAGKDAAFSRILVNTLKAQGHPDPTKATIQVIQPGLYDISHLNTTADLRMIASQLGQSPSARLCLHGPPGTGKTSFGHWLAREVNKPLLIRKASELFSPFVGMTERKIASTFEKATEDGTILLIDEVDSFLQDRTRAKYSWEVTQINEMLTQIESFPGILIASTNLVDHLDQASLRRFDIKIYFDYLLPEQTARLFISHCKHLGIPDPTPDDIILAFSMDIVTPGDFAAVARQHKFQPFRTAGELLQAVIQELGYKSTHLRRIGFQ